MGLRVTARGPVCCLGHSSADSGVPLMPWTFSFRQLLSCLIVAYFGSHRLQRPHGGFTSS